MRRIQVWLCISQCAVLLTARGLQAADAPDLVKIDRHIRNEPVYKAKQPLYGLYVFGPKARTHAWAVFDKSEPGADHYDVLYFDRNANGDLTAPEDRIEGRVNGNSVTFSIGSFTDPLTKQRHTDLSITRQEG